MLCLLESVIMSAIFDLQLPAVVLHMIGIGLTVAAILMDGIEEARKREERRQRKHRRYYQGDDMEDAGGGMQAKVKKVGLPEPKLPPTREYRGDPGAHMDPVYEMKDQALIKKKSGIRKGAHVWTDEERKELIEARAAGRSWDDLAEEYGVSKAAVQIQVTRGRKEKK